MDVAVVGAGRVGTAFALALRAAGHDIVAVSGREATVAWAARVLPGVPVLSAGSAAERASVVLFAVPDDVLWTVVSRVAEEGGFRPEAWAIHVSGSAGLAVLDPAATAGAHRLAVHPLQTFPDVQETGERLRGAGMAITAEDDDGLAFGMTLAREMGSVPFELKDEARPIYHAAAVFASNYVVAVSSLAATLFEDAGVPDPGAAMALLQESTMENIRRMGPAAALTGPAVRGDVTTIERNLSAIRGSAHPEALAPYLSLCRVAVHLGIGSDRLDPDDAAAVLEVLDAWT